jgi:rhodanese-related sulfurtransferase
MSVTQISAQDAFAILETDQNSILIDVRTNEEITFVGQVDSESIEDRLYLLPWKLLPDMRLNANFGNLLKEKIEQTFLDQASNAKIFFLCRSGARSDQAAYHATTLGFKNCYNIISGFEGDIDNKGHRGNINGWKASNLAWRQS